MGAFDLLIAATAIERAGELIVARRNTRWALAHGGREFDRGHYPAMVVLHVALLAGTLAEVHLLARPFWPWLGWPALAFVVAGQGLRWWCIATLGRQWNTRIIVVPGLSLVTTGPYRWLRHPNYLAVAIEGAALPLVHTCWLTCLVFTAVNAVLLRSYRIPAENRALASVLR